MKTIGLQCPQCGKTTTAARDATDPASAVWMAMICPDCDDGDRHSPEFFDKHGNWINPVPQNNPEQSA